MAAAVKSRSGRRLRSSARARRAAANRRRLAASAAAVLVILAAAPLSISALMGWDTSLPGLETAKSFLALMDDRSPGDRTAAELTKTKTVQVSQPEQRALGKITNPPEFEQALAPPPPNLGELPPFAAALTNLGPLMTIPAAPPPGGGIITTADTPPGGGGGTPPPGGDTPENPPPNPPPAVPEPGTWATMLLGFGLTGWLMRRRRRTSAVAHWA